jgi:hypothetical protein
MFDEIHTYDELQKLMHDALRTQHPELIEPNGDSSICDSYDARLAELLHLPRLKKPLTTKAICNDSIFKPTNSI